MNMLDTQDILIDDREVFAGEGLREVCGEVLVELDGNDLIKMFEETGS